MASDVPKHCDRQSSPNYALKWPPSAAMQASRFELLPDLLLLVQKRPIAPRNGAFEDSYRRRWTTLATVVALGGDHPLDDCAESESRRSSSLSVAGQVESPVFCAVSGDA